MKQFYNTQTHVGHVFGMVFFLLFGLVLVGAGCYQTAPTVNTESDSSAATPKAQESATTETKPVNTSPDTVSFSGTVIAGTTTPLIEFNQADYDSANDEGYVVLLYYYANWCPECKVEFEDTKKAFDKMGYKNVVGFRVHFNDDDTTDAEEELAKEFGVAYQHTKVILKNGERVLKSPSSWKTDQYLSEVKKVVEE